MFAYVIRRLLYGLGVVIGVLFVLFVLFFQIATPDDIARRALGDKAPPSAIEEWKASHGYDRPLWPWQDPSDNLLFHHYRSMLSFDFGRSDVDDVPIMRRLREGALPSLVVTLPIFVFSLGATVLIGLFVAFFRETYIDKVGVLLCVLGMSVSILLYIIGGQFLIGKLLRWFPISGFDMDPSVLARFIALPVMIGVISVLGADVRFYRTVFVEETGRDYVRTARAKGAGEMRVMLRHVLRNSLIPILTRVVVAIPFLFVGSLLLENFFGIPGLGSLTVDSINQNDFATLRVIVFVFSLLFIGGQILTDISYAAVDPRVRLE